MLGSNGPGGPRGVRTGNGGAGLTALQTPGQVGLGGLDLMHGGGVAAARYERDNPPSGSENDSDSGEEDDHPVAAMGDSGRRGGVKREHCEMEAAVTVAGQEMGVLPGAYGSMVPGGGGGGGGGGGVAGAKPGKKTRGRVKIKMEFIDNKLRRYTTFSKRKTGIMKKVS